MYVISYDISSDSLRTKIAKELENYGLRVQYSVFECKIDRTRFRELYRKLCQLTEGMETCQKKSSGKRSGFCQL